MLTRELAAKATFVNPETINAHIRTMRHMIRNARLNRQGINTANPQGEVLNYLAKGATEWDDWAARRFRQAVTSDPSYWRQVKPETVRQWAEIGTRLINGKPVPLTDWLLAAAQRGDNLYYIMSTAHIQALRSRIAHVADWFEALLIVTEDPKEAEGERLKAQRFLDKRDRFTLSVAESKANIWFAERQRAYDETLEASGTQEVMPLADGFRWVRIIDPRALDREGSIMQHCVGAGSYDYGVMNDTIRIFSLRDRQNQPHVTIEMTQDFSRVPAIWTIQQARGKQGDVPADKYRSYLKPLLQTVKPDEVQTHDLDGIDIGDIPRNEPFQF
jgi:hypothetical protein